MLKEYPDYKKGEIIRIYNRLSNPEKKEIEEYLKYRQARGSCSENKLKDIQRIIVQFKNITKENNLTLEQLRSFLAMLNESKKTAHTKNDIKVNVKNFLKWKFKDWSDKFSDLEDIKQDSNCKNEEKLNSKVLLKREDIEKIMKTETKMFFKAFFITQYEAGLRTQEIRFLKWSDIILNVDSDISELQIYSQKTKKSRVVFVKEATFYLRQLQIEQENTGKKGVYIFHSKKDINKPIDKATISCWFRNLTSKALGKELWCYLLRHSRGTELYRLAKQNKIAKDTAIQFMGHSEDMSKFYTHLDKEEVKAMLKEQVYKFEDIPEEKKIEFEATIKIMEKENQETKNKLLKIEQAIRKLMSQQRIN